MSARYTDELKEGVSMNIDQTVVRAVIEHMNSDHGADSILIARAQGFPQATSARMLGLDAQSGSWLVETADGPAELAIDWPIPIHERSDIRKAVVEVFEQSQRALAQDEQKQQAPAGGSL